MAHHRKALPRTLSALLTAVFGVLALSPPAAAQVSIVPDRVDGGGTHTFAFRLANERTDTKSTRLELVFPQTPPVAYVKVDPAPGWTATVRSRPLNPPIEVGGTLVREVAAALVVEGGAVAPRQFEQFLVTMGPLPADGRLLFEATQTFANGLVAHWNQKTSPAPAITFGAGPVAPTAEAAGQQPVQATDDASAPVYQVPRSTGGPPFAVLWGAFGLALVVIAVTGYRAHRRRLRAPAAESEPERTEVGVE
ncbi:DUF1775 domain-containing protein [Amycolatopsis rifamycinica]|uniref:YncI copper-binding domain-containing protein n=1 Tax=Amycolatopsis rifamycinica TaxID=287986 RepID=A0A066U058_9PSEU|nr:DUF1775 domain-containing protein [Amycolatopsis rifamycinica]KDN19207.1 hypothetical protein DV20_26485 [Amycolatopsis rifamycinica]